MCKKQTFSPEFEIFVADFYKNKMQSAIDRGIEWKLNLVSVRNLLRTQKCPFTGINLTVPRSSKAPLSSDLTIDRIDNKKGYVPGNVMTVSRKANNLKSMFENPEYGMSFDDAVKCISKMDKKVTSVQKEKK